MAGSGREARRRRILEGGQDRLALITGRKPNQDPGTSPPFDPSSPPNLLLHDFLRPSPDQPSVSHNEEENFRDILSSRDHLAANLNQDDALDGRSKEQPFARKSEPSNEPSRASTNDPSRAPTYEPSRAPAFEDRGRQESPSAAQKAIFTASEVILRVAQMIPISNVTSQQVSAAVAVTEHDRFLCAVTMAILVVLSYAGFPVVGSRIFRWIILFRPLFLLLITNITLVVRRLLPDNQRNLVRGDKDKDKDNTASVLGDGYAWAEDAGRALEVGLMLQNVSGALFLDCSVYATIVVFGLSLFG